MPKNDQCYNVLLVITLFSNLYLWRKVGWLFVFVSFCFVLFVILRSLQPQRFTSCCTLNILGKPLMSSHESRWFCNVSCFNLLSRIIGYWTIIELFTYEYTRHICFVLWSHFNPPKLCPTFYCTFGTGEKPPLVKGAHCGCFTNFRPTNQI